MPTGEQIRLREWRVEEEAAAAEAEHKDNRAAKKN